MHENKRLARGFAPFEIVQSQTLGVDELVTRFAHVG
jgi:hypothetical protein